VLQCVAVRRAHESLPLYHSEMQYESVVVCCIVLQYVAVCCSLLSLLIVATPSQRNAIPVL